MIDSREASEFVMSRLPDNNDDDATPLAVVPNNDDDFEGPNEKKELENTNPSVWVIFTNNKPVGYKTSSEDAIRCITALALEDEEMLRNSWVETHVRTEAGKRTVCSRNLGVLVHGTFQNVHVYTYEQVFLLE